MKKIRNNVDIIELYLLATKYCNPQKGLFLYVNYAKEMEVSFSSFHYLILYFI